jgi:hypothetical protein
MADSQPDDFLEPFRKAGQFVQNLLSYQFVALVGIFLFAFGALAWVALFNGVPPESMLGLSTNVATGAMVYGTIALLIAFFMFAATRLGIITSSPSRLLALEDRLETRVEQMRSELENLQKEQRKAIPEQQLTRELDQISKDFFSKATFKKLESEIENKYGSTINIGTKVNSIRKGVENSINSLNDQVSQQRNNANLNMLFGLVFSSGGIGVLGYFIYYYFQSEADFAKDIVRFLTSFFPKFTFVILIETVAFFFLNLYREDRNMIRYFRNEITNLEAKYLAMEAAARFEEKDVLSKILLILANTERNFTIRKNEKLIVEALREEDSRLFDKTVEKVLSLIDTVTRKSSVEGKKG